MLLHKCLRDCFCELFCDRFCVLAALLSLVASACTFKGGKSRMILSVPIHFKIAMRWLGLQSTPAMEMRVLPCFAEVL